MSEQWWKEHAEALDKNWSSLHGTTMGYIRKCLGMPNASVGEMVDKINSLKRPEGFPRVITLCGSTRFSEEYTKATRKLTLEGKIVILVGLFVHQEGLDMEGPIKKMLDELHLRKIDLADEIMVIAPLCRKCPLCGTRWIHGRIRVEKCSCKCEIEDVVPTPYIGESTSREIAYATAQGKSVSYYTGE